MPREKIFHEAFCFYKRKNIPTEKKYLFLRNFYTNMRNTFLILTLLFSAIFIFSCAEEPKMTTEGPDYAIKRWQGLVDSSNFQAAKLYSTERTIKWLDKNNASTEAGDSLGYQVNFTKIDCKISGDSAVCNCTFNMKGDTTTYKDIYFAKKINYKWLVDLNVDENEILE
jgi:hypothetical protein